MKLSDCLDGWLREVFEERAGICEFDGQMTKEKAEALAKAEMESHLKAVEKAREAQA